ncbi:DUF7269 family protein [Halostella litorea]|uniref:DUF7269 family protein n=1 Tax=Halostella litorea TaxID=2528831 RepID=UPI0010929661|nr:hypothetical protein [Halostella litorea]
MNRWGRRLVVAVGATTLAAGVALAYAPDLLPAGVRTAAREAAASTGSTRIAAAVAAFGLLAVLWSVRSSGEPGRSEPIVAAPPEDPTTDDDVAGEAFDAAVERVGERELSAWGRGPDPAATLYETALVVLNRSRPDADAEALVAAGTWTDDRVAAGFLGDERATAWTFGERLRLWLAPERETRRRAARTVDALRRELDRHERRWHGGGADGRPQAGGDPQPRREDGPRRGEGVSR